MNLSVRFGTQSFDAFRSRLQPGGTPAKTPAAYPFAGELNGLRDDLKARPFASGTTLADLFAQMNELNSRTRGWLDQPEVAKLLNVETAQVNAAFDVFDQMGLLKLDRTPPGGCPTGNNITPKGTALIDLLKTQVG